MNYDADAGIPRDAQLKVEEIPEGSDLWEAYRKQTAAALGADDVRLPGLYDITIIDAEGNEIEPQAPVSVSITLVNAEEGNTELHVVHFTEEIPQELVAAAAEEKANLENPENEQTETQPLPEEDRIESEKIESSVDGQTVTFETKGFSIYAFAYAIVTYYRTASGETYEITLSFGREARIPEDAELAVREILPGDEAYEEYYAQATKAAMEAAENNGSELPMATGARLFDIEIHGENGKIEPAAPVQVTIRLVGDTKSDMLSVVHFAETGTEVVALQENPEGEADGISEIRFEAESFSVYTVVSVDQLVSQGKYILVSGIAGDPGANIGYSESWGTDYFTRVVNGMAITDEPNSAEHGLDAVGVHWWEDGGQFYVGGEATEWTLEYNDNTQAYLFEIEKGGTTYYFRWLGYDRGDGQMEWDGMELTTDRGLATAFGFEPTGDNDGTYWIYLAQDGFYKQRYLQNYQYAGTNEWSSRCYRLTSVSDRSVLQDKAFKFRIGQKSEDFDPVAARKISVQSLTTNSSYIIYRKLEDENGNEELYALASDGTFVRVYDGGDLLYYRETGKNIFWTYNESNGVYLESLNNGERVFINPRASSGQTIISNETEDIKSLTLPGKNNGLYGSTIECWDQPAYDYAGLHVTTVKDNDGNTTAVNLTAGKQKAGQSDEFLFAVASSMPSNEEATPVATVNSASLGIQITMYDYGDPEHDYGFGNKLDEMTSAVGSDAYTPHAAHALVKHYLDPDSGLPLPNGSDTPMSGVFGNSTGGAITSIITGVNHLFLQSYYNESGTFRYRSEDNYAYIPRDGSNPNFTVYQQIATPYTTDRAVGHAYFYHGHFMPFNDIDMSNHISHLLDQYGTSPLSLEDGRAYEDVYGVVGTPNYFTGLKMEANFVQPSDGTLEDGSPMVFKFTGDDDMWVYIDGVLVLDIGGIHEPLSGTINFATGKVTNPSGSGVRETTLYNIFMAVKNDPNTPQDVKDTINQIQWDGDTFADFTTHSFKAFYMERGAGASNLDLQFNLKVTKMDEFTVRKQLPEGVDARFSNQLFKYQATYRHGNEVLPLHAGISGVCNNITYKDIRDENGQPISVN
ncbi:MAG: hypothetical protein IKD62_07850, partial [Oscillospiraceae bacterium]|nr:hypothetical protein [Oscillospiraceae bacterium]